MNNQTTTETELRKAIHMTLVNVASYKDANLNEYTDAILQLIQQEKKAVVAEIIKQLEATPTLKWEDAEHCSCLKYAIDILKEAHSQAADAKERSEDREGKEGGE